VRIDLLLRSTTFKLSLVYSGLLVGAFVAAAALTYAGSRAAAESEIRKLIELEASALASEIGLEGLEPAIAAIEFRAERPGSFEYWVSDADGNRLFGDLAGMEGPNGWRHFAVDDGADGAEGRESMLVLTQSLEGGVRLSVGDDLNRLLVVRRAILETLFIVGGCAVLLSLIVGFYFTGGALRRVNRLTAAMQAVADGDLAVRVPVITRAHQSDVDAIGLGVNAMLDRIDGLVSGVRRVSRDVAHDLRTPLFHLRQRLEAARAATGDAKDAAIGAADEKASEIVRAFDAILRLAEIEAGAAGTRFAAVDIASIAEAAVDAWRPDIEQSGRSIIGLSSAPVFVVGDRDLLFQAISNLIENAMRHTPPGAEIRVGVSHEDAPAILVTDNGPGVSPDQAGEVVKPFARLDASRSSPGTGLGLSIVAAIAARHGAKLSLGDARPGLDVRIEFGREAGPPKHH
jgi:signal transduction histidine kinase